MTALRDELAGPETVEAFPERFAIPRQKRSDPFSLGMAIPEFDDAAVDPRAPVRRLALLFGP